MAVHWREGTWLQTSNLVAAAGQPTSRNMGWRYAEHRGSGRSWSGIDAKHRRLIAATLLFGQLFASDAVMVHFFGPLSRC